MDRIILPDLEAASSIALTSLAFLAQDQDRLEQFMATTGIDVDTLRAEASEPHMMASVLEYLTQDESLLLVFTANSNTAPETLLPALHVLQNA